MWLNNMYMLSRLFMNINVSVVTALMCSIANSSAYNSTLKISRYLRTVVCSCCASL